MNHKEDRLGWSCCVLNDGWVVMGIAVSLNGFITDASAWLENQKMTGSAMNAKINHQQVHDPTKFGLFGLFTYITCILL